MAGGKLQRIFLTDSRISQDGNIVICGQNSQDEELIHQLMERIKASSCSFHPIRNIEVGEMCLARFAEDGLWYRATVRGKSGRHCSVEFIDYGNIQPTSIENLRDIPDSFRSLKPQAQSFIFCPDGRPANQAGAWTSDVIDFINDQYMYAEVEVNVTETDSCSLVARSNVISQSLANKGHISLDKPYRPAVEKDSSIEHERYVIGKKMNVIISNIERNGTFHCYNASNGHFLSDMLDALYDTCENQKPQPLTTFCVGKLCCARYSVDGNWYRAEIIGKERDKVMVRFLDYGNTNLCDVKSLVVLEKGFKKLPFQAIHCSLSGYHNEENLIRILNPLTDRQVVMEVVNNDTKPCVVRLFDDGAVVGLASSPSKIDCDAEGPKQKPYQASYNQVSISLGARKQVVLKDTMDVKSIWCVLSENLLEVDNLHEETNEIYSRVANGHLDLQPDQSDINGPCVAFDAADKCWYRAKLLCLVGPSQYKVLYVDSGKIQLVHSTAIRIVSDALLRYPAFAIRFTLTAVYSSSGDLMQLQRCEALMPNMKEKSFVAVFNDYDQKQDLYFVELYDVGRHFGFAYSRPGSLIADLNIPLNAELPIRISSIDDPDCIWVQLLDYKSDLITLNGKLDAYYNALPNQALSLTDVQRGQVCCMKSTKTKNWTRVEIEYLYDDVMEVKYVDYGYIDSIHLSEAKVLLPEFMSLPKQAICCKFHNLEPAGRRWCNGSVRYLKEFVAKAGVSVNFVEKRGDLFVGQMYVSFKGENRFRIADGLVKEGLAQWLDPGAAEVTNIQPPTDSLSKLRITPEASSCKRVLYSHCGNDLVGAEVPARVCDSPSPSDFFILPRNSSVQCTYGKLAREMKVYLKAAPATFQDVYVGMPCVCIIDHKCYRAAIISEERTANPDVFLVDYGVKEKVNITALRNIISEHITCIPPVAVRCTLHGIVEPKNKFWSSNAMVKFSKFCNEATKDLICTFYGCVTDGISQFFMANLTTPFHDIAKELVDNANCCLVEPMGKMSPPFTLKSFVYSGLGVGIGKEDSFYVTHVERADLFYCQLMSNFALISDFMDQVQDYCRRNHQPEDNPSHDELAFSPPCFSRYKTEWYRALYMSASAQTPKEALVFFVDYGNFVSVPLSDIIPLDYKSGLADVPVQAIPCCLTGVVSPIQDLHKSESVLGKMKAVLCGQGLKGVVTGCTNGKFHLDLYIDSERVNDQIVGHNSPQPLISLVSNPDSVDHDPLLKGKFKDLGSVDPKSVHSVFISHIRDPNHFHVRLESMEETFNECVAEVDGFYTATRQQDYVVRSLQNGDVVCAKHPTTFRWCRALVLDAESYKPSNALVEYIDFGERANISILDEAKKLMRSMLHWPRMAISCQLANVSPLAKCWEVKDLEFFNDACRGASCRMRFNTFDAIEKVWTVDLKIKGKNLAHMLVENNHAKFVCVPSSVVSSNTELVRTKPLDLWKDGNVKQVYISHVESVNECYLQFVETEQTLNNMMQKMNDPNFKFRVATKPNIKQSYVTQYQEDGRFYRCNIVSLSSTIEIIYVDYGNRAFINVEDLLILPKEFSTLPGQALKCRVSCPPDLDKDSVVTKLEELAVDETISMQATCLGCDSNSSTVDVELSVVQGGGQEISFQDFFSSKKVESAQNDPVEADVPCKKFKALRLRTGEDVKVYVSQVDGPLQIWIQLSEYAVDLDNLMDQIDVFCKDDSAQALQTVQTGVPCLAKYYDDNGWYRGEVLEVEQNKAVIHFVDYGNKDSVKLDDIKEADNMMLALPKQAVKCKLLDLKAVHEWNLADTDDFIERVSDVQLTAQFFPCKDSTDLYDVKLIYPCGKSLNDEWNETLTNRSTHTPNSDGQGDVTTSDHHALKSSVSDKHIVTDRGDHVIVENLMPMPTSIDFNTSIDAKLMPLTPCVTMPRKITMCAGSLEDGYVSHCEDPGHFFVRLSKYAVDLDKVHELVSKSLELSLNGPAEVGKYYVAKSLEDGEWYRAKCTGITDGEYAVCYIDYGNEAFVKLADIKPMHIELDGLAMQAIECQIHDLIPKVGSWGDVTDFMIEMTLDKKLKIRFIELNESGQWSVNLEVEEVDVRNQILEKFGSVVCCGAKETKSEGEHVLPPVQPGVTLCIKVVLVEHDVMTCVLLNLPTSLLEDYVKMYTENYGGNIKNKLLTTEEIKVSSVYLWKSLNWRCVKIVPSGNGKCQGIDLVVKELVIFTENDLFLCPSSQISSSAQNMIVYCVLNQDTSLGLTTDSLQGKIVAADFSSKNDQGCWIVNLSLLRQNLTCGVSSMKTVPVTPAPEVIITDFDKSDQETCLRQWSLQLLPELSVFFSNGNKIFRNCPASLEPLRNQLTHFKTKILANLPEVEKKELLSGDTLKRFSTDLAEGQFPKELPAKKMKLDMDENSDIENEKIEGMFSVGDEFEVIVSNIYNPGDFYVRPFLVMSEEPANATKAKNLKECSKKILQGNLCIAKCSDLFSKVHHWVRATVVDFEDGNFMLMDIDTGAEFFAKTEDIYPVGEAIESWPAFSLQCSLAGVRPYADSEESGGWSNDATLEFKSLLCDVSVSDRVKISIASIVTDDGTRAKRFVVNVKINGMSLAKTLISLQVAEAIAAIDDKENATLVPNIDGPNLGRGSARKPLADLMFTPHIPSAVITPHSSESVGCSLPDFDLLAVPWKIIRTTLEGSQTESFLDNVFISDAEESFVGVSAQFSQKTGNIVGNKGLASFKIYCSTKSSQSSNEDVTLDAESIQKNLPTGFDTAEPVRSQDNAKPSSVTSSLLNLLTPVTASSGNVCDDSSLDVAVAGITNRSDHFHANEKEKLLDEVCDRLIRDTFSQIEEEETHGGTAENGLVVQGDHSATSAIETEKKLDEICNELVKTTLDQIEEEEGTAAIQEVSECTIPDSLDDVAANSQTMNTMKSVASSGMQGAENEEDSGCTTILDSMCENGKEKNRIVDTAGTGLESPATQIHGEELSAAICLEHLDVGFEDSLLSSVPVKHLESVQETENVSSVAQEIEQFDICKDTHPENSEENAADHSYVSGDEVAHDNNTNNLNLDTKISCHDSANPSLIKLPKENRPESRSLESEDLNLCQEAEKGDAYTFDIQQEHKDYPESITDDFKQLPNCGKVEQSLSAPETSDKCSVSDNIEQVGPHDSVVLDKSVDDLDYYSAEESVAVHKEGHCGGDTKDECLPECDRYKACLYPLLPEGSSHSVRSSDEREGHLDSHSQHEESLTDSLKKMTIDKEESDKTQTSGDSLLSVSHSTDTTLSEQEEEVLGLLRNMSIEDSPPEDENGRENVTVRASGNPCDYHQKLQNSQVIVNENVSSEGCFAGHQHQKLYICCLPKMQLEVGDKYPVSYMNSTDPLNIQLQFDYGAETEEWRRALCIVNTLENVEKLEKKEFWESDMICLVQSLADSSWERGRILAVDGEVCEVELIDYGEHMAVAKSLLREVPESLCLYPRQSAPCSLVGITTVKNPCTDVGWGEEVNKNLTNILFCSTLTAEIVEICESPTEENFGIKLFLIGEDGEADDVGKMLVEAGMAKVLTSHEECKRTEEDDPWETILQPEVITHHSVLGSSNIDLSNLEEAFGSEDPVATENRGSRDGLEGDAVYENSSEELNMVARDIRKKVIANAIIITSFGSDDPLEGKSPVAKKLRKSKDMYIDVEKIPRILEVFDPTEMD